MSEFRKELTGLINKHSMEIGSHTPDFILAEYLTDCLDAFDKTDTARRKWYVRDEADPSQTCSGEVGPAPEAPDA